MDIFDADWNEALCEAWNCGPNTEKLGGAGDVLFSLVTNGEQERSVTFHWDRVGKMTFSDGGSRNSDAPEFSATGSDWVAYIGGEFGGVRGVATGRMQYTGPMLFAMRYGAKFDLLARTARNME